jgi:hypothetical protein
MSTPADMVSKMSKVSRKSKASRRCVARFMFPPKRSGLDDIRHRSRFTVFPAEVPGRGGPKTNVWERTFPLNRILSRSWIMVLSRVVARSGVMVLSSNSGSLSRCGTLVQAGSTGVSYTPVELRFNRFSSVRAGL